MTLLVLSDLHGSAADTALALEAFKREEADYLVLLGDVLARGNWQSPLAHQPLETARLLNQVAKKTIAVQGNCDLDGLERLAFPLAPGFSTILTANRRLFCTHGHLYTADKLPPLQAGDVFCFGHTHIATLQKKDGILLLNPGSVALPKNGQPKSYALLTSTDVFVKALDGSTLMTHALTG